ncbi:hypothetical protein N7540_003090 [Penicillium herquei]|nr:hypothetical protein N7540_003090 [Penicillium herquei]
MGLFWLVWNQKDQKRNSRNSGSSTSSTSSTTAVVLSEDASQYDKYPEETEHYGIEGEDAYGHLFPDF